MWKLSDRGGSGGYVTGNGYAVADLSARSQAVHLTVCKWYLMQLDVALNWTFSSLISFIRPYKLFINHHSWPY